MKTVMSWVLIIGCLGLAVFALVTQLPLSCTQRRSVAAAFEHGSLLKKQINLDARFTNVAIHGQSSDVRGLVLAHGCVQSVADAIALRNLVEASHPPVAVIADIHVGSMPTNKTWPEVEWKIDPRNEYPWVTERLKGHPGQVPDTTAKFAEPRH